MLWMDEPEEIIKVKYTQCKLQKGNVYYVTWIPAKYAKVNKILRIKDDNGWKVVETYSSMEYSDLLKDSSDYRIHRNATDI